MYKTKARILGYRADGRPIREIRGASMPAPPVADPTVQPPPATIPVTLSPAPPAPVTGITSADIDRIRAEAVAEVTRTFNDQQTAAQARFDAMAAEVQSLTQTAEQQRAAAEAQARTEQEAAEAARQSALTEQQRLAEGQQNLAQQVTSLQDTIALQAATIDRERQFADLSAYRVERLAAETDSIMPTLTDFVVGNSREEIDASIELVKRKTAETVGQLQQARVQQFQAAPGTAPSGVPPVGGPADVIDHTANLSAEDIKNMPLAQYAALRPQLLSQAAQANGQGRGLFG